MSIACRSAAKEMAAGDRCRRISFQEIDELVYKALQIPFYHLDLIGIQRVSWTSLYSIY
jgi:hypothetical protein